MSGSDRQPEAFESREQAEAESTERSAAERSAATDPADDEDAPSPFDHPAFLPVLLWALALWFGYDGWFNENIEAVNFNRYGFGLLTVAAIYYTIRAVRETRAANPPRP